MYRTLEPDEVILATDVYKPSDAIGETFMPVTRSIGKSRKDVDTDIFREINPITREDIIHDEILLDIKVDSEYQYFIDIVYENEYSNSKTRTPLPSIPDGGKLVNITVHRRKK